MQCTMKHSPSYFQYIDDNEECQYSMPELVNKLDGYLAGADGYATIMVEAEVAGPLP